MRAYQKLCTEFYEIDKAQAPPEALAFYRNYARAAQGRILEPLCGSGRFLLPLLAEGLDIEGTDYSKDMLDACRHKAKALGLEPRLKEEALKDLAVKEAYALAFIPTGSFSLIIDKAEALDCLQRLRHSLRPGGKLVLEFEPYGGTPSGSSPWGGRWVTRPDGAKVVVNWLNQAGSEPQVNQCLLRYDLIKDGKIVETEVEDFPLRAYEVAEAESLLKKAGFSGIKLLSTEKGMDHEKNHLFEALKA